MPETPKKKQRAKVLFKMEWEDAYGIQVCTRDPQTQLVTGVRCLFCLAFGRVANPGTRKRSMTQKSAFWNATDNKYFRSDSFTDHLDSSHRVKYAEYCAASAEDRRTFFDNIQIVERSPKKQKTISDYGLVMQKKVVVVHADIVKVCMKELLGVEQMTDKEYEELGIDECSYPVIDMASGYTSSNSMESSSSSTTNRSLSITSSRVIKSNRKKACDRLFKPETPASSNLTATVKSLLLYNHVRDLVSFGNSFAQVANNLEATKVNFSEPRAAGVSRDMVSDITYVICAEHLVLAFVFHVWESYSIFIFVLSLCTRLIMLRLSGTR